MHFLSGINVDIDEILPHGLPSGLNCLINVARDPVSSAMFFHTVVDAFFEHLLGFSMHYLIVYLMGVKVMLY